MADAKELDLLFMTEAEVTEAFKNATLNHMRIIVSTDVQNWCDNRVPKLIDMFSKSHYENMRTFCKETVDTSFEPKIDDLLLCGFELFFGTYHAHTKRNALLVAEDINALGKYLVMNYYTRKLSEDVRSLTLMVDFLPQYVADQHKLFTGFQQVRCTHEFTLNLLH